MRESEVEEYSVVFQQFMLKIFNQEKRTSRFARHSDGLPLVGQSHNPSFAAKYRSRSPLPDVRVACNSSCLIWPSNIKKWLSIRNNVNSKRKLTSLISQIIMIADTTDFNGGNPSEASLIARRATRAAARLVFFEPRSFSGILSRTSVRRTWRGKKERIHRQERHGTVWHSLRYE